MISKMCRRAYSRPADWRLAHSPFSVLEKFSITAFVVAIAGSSHARGRSYLRQAIMVGQACALNSEVGMGRQPVIEMQSPIRHD
jgi:hypothetical protein